MQNKLVLLLFTRRCVYVFVCISYRRSQWPRGLGHELSSKAGVVGSNPTRSIDVCMRLFCIYAVLCVGRGRAKDWSPSKERYWLCIGLRNWKSNQGQQRPVEPLMDECVRYQGEYNQKKISFVCTLNWAVRELARLKEVQLLLTVSNKRSFPFEIQSIIFKENGMCFSSISQVLPISA
jgi:hypothetical protein